MEQRDPLRGELVQALKWQVDAGADEVIGETPVDRFTEKTGPPVDARAPEERLAPLAAPPAGLDEAPGPREVHPPPPPPIPAAAPAAPASRSAYEAAAAAQSVADIRAALEAFDGCPLKRTATNLVYCDGNPESRIVFVGEAPGAEEDRQGLPFVGPAGRLLDRMLAAIGLDRSQVLITNTIFWRPPGNRNPSPSEVAMCLPFVARTIEVVDPEVLVMVGGTAAKTLLARSEGIMKLRGRWFEFETPRMVRPVPARAIFHPAYLLRTPGQKRLAWRDLIEIKKRLADTA